MEANLQSLGCLDCIELGFIKSTANDIASMPTSQRNQYEELKQK